MSFLINELFKLSRISYNNVKYFLFHVSEASKKTSEYTRHYCKIFKSVIGKGHQMIFDPKSLFKNKHT